MFNTVCYWLNVIGLSYLVAGLRWILHRVGGRAATEKPYRNPEGTGYKGYITIERVGVVAFRRLDGSIQYRW